MTNEQLIENFALAVDSTEYGYDCWDKQAEAALLAKLERCDGLERELERLKRELEELCNPNPWRPAETGTTGWETKQTVLWTQATSTSTPTDPRRTS